jgi:hypothetical protein
LSDRLALLWFLDIDYTFTLYAVAIVTINNGWS